MANLCDKIHICNDSSSPQLQLFCHSASVRGLFVDFQTAADSSVLLDHSARRHFRRLLAVNCRVVPTEEFIIRILAELKPEVDY